MIGGAPPGMAGTCDTCFMPIPEAALLSILNGKAMCMQCHDLHWGTSTISSYRGTYSPIQLDGRRELQPDGTLLIKSKS